jgi:hypothetical protein
VLRFLPRRTGGQLVNHLWMHLSDAGFFPCHPPSRLPVNYEHQLCLLKLNVDSSSLDEFLHIPSTLMVHRHCPRTSSSPDLLVYRCLAYSDGSSEDLFSEIFLLHSDKELDGIPYSDGSFNIVSYPSRIWETLPAIYIGRSTFVLS